MAVTFDQVSETLQAWTGIESCFPYQPETTLERLGIDDGDMVDMLLLLAEKFGIDDIYAAPHFKDPKTVGDVFELVKAQAAE